MKIALCADETYPVQATLKAELDRRGHKVILFGAALDGRATSWVKTAEQAANAIARGDCDEGVFSCWTGTGVSIAANKIPGIRAALCNDPGTAAGARIWNHANVLCLSHRLLSDDMAKEILAAWFDTVAGTQGQAGVNELNTLERRLPRLDRGLRP